MIDLKFSVYAYFNMFWVSYLRSLVNNSDRSLILIYLKSFSISSYGLKLQSASIDGAATINSGLWLGSL